MSLAILRNFDVSSFGADLIIFNAIPQKKSKHRYNERRRLIQFQIG